MSNEIMNRHIMNLKRSISKDGDTLKYESIYDYDGLRDYWVRTSNNLGYGLKVQLNRTDGRLILNRDGWEEVIMKSAEEVANILGSDINSFINNEVYDEINNNIDYLLNNITYNQNTGFNMPKKPRVKKDFASKLGAMLGRALVKNLSNIWKDMTGTGRR